jgi:hypothetical protein
VDKHVESIEKVGNPCQVPILVFVWKDLKKLQFPAGAGNFSPYHRVQNGSRAHPT